MASFFAFEGADGAGKSTQAGLFYQFLLSQRIKAVLTREPGGTLLAEKLRAILLGEGGVADPLTELLILNAARRDHIENFIKPRLADGYVVICDRFIGSTIAYQGEMKDLSFEKIIELHNIATGGFYPDLTFVFDIAPKLAEQRIKGRDNFKNHYDQISLAMREKVRQSFGNLSQVMKSPVEIIEASGEVETVAAQVIANFKSFTKDKK